MKASDFRRLDKICASLGVELPSDELCMKMEHRCEYMDYIFKPSQAQSDLLNFVIMDAMTTNSPSDMFEEEIHAYYEALKYSDEEAILELEKELL